MSYLEGSTWHKADGSTVELDEAYFSAVELGDQLVATGNNNGRLTVDVIDADGSVADSFRAFSHAGRQRRPHHGRLHRHQR